ncbi:MAG: LAGLIDADG family homing endonuclease, partial [Patescibacteria group bacterium]
FSEHGIEKAYLVGFRIGDLYVTHNKSSVTIKSNTTQLAQVNLMKSLFSQYGPIWVSSPQSRKNVYHCTVTLNHSFQFLMKKPSTIPLWISRSSHAFWAFIAGYTDAEGTIRIYSSRARLRVGSYDKMILKQIHLWLIKNGIKNSFRLESPADFVHRNGDFYRVDIMDRYALYTTLQHLIPLLRHERRKKDAIEALLNVTRRIKHLI